jgi:hypothetical protein
VVPVGGQRDDSDRGHVGLVDRRLPGLRVRTVHDVAAAQLARPGQQVTRDDLDAVGQAGAGRVAGERPDRHSAVEQARDDVPADGAGSGRFPAAIDQR